METDLVSSEFTSELNTISACESDVAVSGLDLPHSGEDAPNGDCATASNSFNSTKPKENTSTSTFSRIESADTLSRGSVPTQRGASKKFAGHDVEQRYKLCLRAEVVGLSIVIVIVWCLLALPIVFYHIPVTIELEGNQTASSSSNTSDNGIQSCDIDIAHKYISVCGGIGTDMQPSTCAAPITYTESVCLAELNSLKNCLQNDIDKSSHPLVVTDSDKENAILALGFVDSIASEACAAEVKPFLCLYFFGLCDSASGVSYHPTASNCRNLRDNVCSFEWQIAAGHLELPDCDTVFSDETVPCDANNGNEGNNTTASSSGELGSGSLPSTDVPSNVTTLTPQVQQQTLDCNNITCREGFYCLEGANVCNPSCYSWKQYPRATNMAIDAMILLSACIGVVSGVGVLVVAGLRWKKVLVFPSSLAVYQTITLMTLAFFVIVNYMDNSGLHCTDKDLFQSLLKSTPFCVLSGIVFYYCLFQLAVFWLCHVLALFWKIKFPFHSRAFQMAHRVKYVHIASAAIGLLLPTIPVIATMSQSARGKSSAEALEAGLGFGIVRFPPLLCTSRDGDTTFYSLVLPILVILMFGMTILLIIFWIIHRQHGLFKARQSKNPYKIGTAERKILIVFVYYVILAVIALLAFSLTIRDGDQFLTEVFRYFECESKGVDPLNPCDASRYQMILHVALTSLSYILLGLFPVFNFMFVINVRELKLYLQAKLPFLFRSGRKRKAAKFQVSDTPSNTSTSSTTGMLSSTPQTPKDKKTFKF